MTAAKRPPAKRQKASPCGGRYRTRTDDLFRVKEARYQLRQSPMTLGSRIDTTGTNRLSWTTPTDTREIGVWFCEAGIFGYCFTSARDAGTRKCGCSAVVAHHLAKVRVASSNLVIRSSAESLFERFTARGVNPHGGVAERLGTGLQSRLHGFESRRHLTTQLKSPILGAISAAVARFPDTEEVTGSIPVSRTTETPRRSGGFVVARPRSWEICGRAAPELHNLDPWDTVAWSSVGGRSLDSRETGCRGRPADSERALWPGSYPNCSAATRRAVRR